MTADNNKTKTGALFARRPESDTQRLSADAKPVKPVNADRAPQKLAFAGLFVFTLLLYARPQELFSSALGELPLVKFVALGTLMAYVAGKIGKHERFTIWPLEMKMLAIIVFLGVMLTPVAFRPERSIEMLTDTFFKVIIIFVLMVNL